MDTYDQMMVDNRYPSDYNDEKYLQQMSNKDEDGNGALGRRVYLESPSFGDKEEEDMYRYVPSRLTDHTSTIIDHTLPTRTGGTLMDALDFELDVLGTNNTRSNLPYRNPIAPARQLSNIPRADPRQDPLLGPLLAELDTMSNQPQQFPPPSPPVYRQNSLPYQSNLVRPAGSSPSNHALTNVANRTVNDALLEAELYNSLDPKSLSQQRQRVPLSALNQSRPPNINGTDVFVPSSYTHEPVSFLSHFGPEDQLFQRPLLNTLGQNYVPNPRPPQQRDTSFDQTHTRMSPPQRTTYIPPQQRDTSFDQTHTRISPPHRTTYVPPRSYISEQPPPPPSSNPFIEYQRSPPQQQQQQRYDEPIPRQANNQEMFFTDQPDDQQQQQQQQQQQTSQHSGDQQDPDFKRQAIWNELQRTSAKAHEKNAKKYETPNRIKAPFGSNPTWNGSGSQQSSALSKSPQRPFHQPPPVSKSNHIEENIDMIKNKENFYHRYPARKYENTYSKRTDHDKQEQEPHIQSSINDRPRQSSLPVTMNINPNENSQSGSLPMTVTIPLDTHMNRPGDKISVNIDLRLVDLQNLQQQGTEQPNWSSGDPLERHIRKLERNIEQSLPITHAPQRSPVIPSTGVNPSMGRYGRQTAGAGRGGYNPPVYGGDYYNYSDKGREEDSYLAKLNYAKKTPQFKPYTGRDYEQFKKNYGFGTGHLGYNFESTTHKEKTEKLNKTRQYGQQIEARNKKKMSEMSRRTLSDTRLPKAPRPLEYPSSAIRRKQFSGKTTYSSPAMLSEIVPFIPARRPTEVLYRPAPQLLKSSEIVERENRPINSPTKRRESEIAEREKRPINSPLKRREERSGQDRIHQRRLSPTKSLPPIGNNKRRPVRFDNIQDLTQQRSNVDQITRKDNDENRVLEAIQQELNARPLNPNEELIIIEE